MTTHNPASEGTYCAGASSATWYIDGVQVALFSNLVAGTNFKKEEKTINGKKIIWDTVNQYLINNPDNYSYSIEPLIGTPDCKRVYVNILWDMIYGIAIGRSTGSIPISSPYCGYRFSGGVISILCRGIWGNCGELGWYDIDVYSLVYPRQNTRVLINGADISTVTPDKYNLKIIDGGLETVRSIIDTASIHIVDIPTISKKFVFTGGSTKIEVDAGGVVSLVCTKDCPPNTLDCGDCCLDCASIFNGISGIRKIIAGLK
jgi:hypothetical protein